MLVEFSEVALTRDIGASEDVGWEKVDYRRGDVGSLADGLGGQGMVAVQFAWLNGRTAGLAYLSESDIRPLEPDDLRCVRLLPPAANNLASYSAGEGKFPKPDKLARIVLTRPIPELALLPGDLGMVVECRPEAGEYTIRMSVGHDMDGPVITLPEKAIRIPKWYELPAVRKLQPVAPAPAAARHTAG